MEAKDFIVVKVGSDTVANPNGSIRTEFVEEIFSSIKTAATRGVAVAVVSSGAVKYGRHILRDDRASIGVAASIGQPALYQTYADAARRTRMSVAQLLLTRFELTQQEYFKKILKTMRELVSRGVIPIINENDAITAGTDISFGDNDSLAASLAIFLNAKKIIILTHLEGLYDKDPSLGPGAHLLTDIDDANTILLKMISGKISAGGRGGMLSKIKLARLCTAVGIGVQLVNGRVAGNIGRAFGRQKVGTMFHPREFSRKLTDRERWMFAARNSDGSIEIDDGAQQALRNGKSLLAVGVKRIYGKFEADEIIEIINTRKHSIAVGVVKKSSRDIIPVLGTLKARGIELIHVDNLIAFNNSSIHP
ncbi:glutamate 5-kinase [Candidatus Uhrbacteria bacterium]|nr:glutamate 5-kinase [Candidatus Uhrbacteria bacterium]